VTPLDLVGPLTVLRNLSPGWPFRAVVVGQRREPTPTDTPLQTIPAKTFAEVPSPFAVVVPVGGPSTLQAMRDDSLLAYVRSAADTPEDVGSTATARAEQI
jgi:putative intracellular protease/amidase